MKKIFLIFPVTLFDSVNYENDTILFEEPHYFTRHNFHQTKLIYHRITMKKYFTEKNIKYYLNFNDTDKLENILKKYDCLEFIDPSDNAVVKKYTKLCKKLNININIIETLNFLIKKTEKIPTKKEDAIIRHDKTFYPYMRKKLNLLMKDNKPLNGKYSFDKENRKKMKSKENIKQLDLNKYRNNDDFILIEKSIKYIKKYFPENINHEHDFNNFIYPISTFEAFKLLKFFFFYKIQSFGDYQDYINKNDSFLYHSQLSPPLNIGLLIDNDIIKYLNSIELINVKINNLEGFIRQIIGWRNYCFYIYNNYDKEIRKMNFFNHNRKITNKIWNTQIEIIDDTINKAKKTCYLNHIERLMVIGSFMLLCEFNPIQVMNWYTETVSIDAYDVFMVPNVLCMSQFCDGGKIMMTRPYFCSSSYLLKMSDYKKKSDKKVSIDGEEYEWYVIIDELYRNFVFKNKDYLKTNYSTALIAKKYKNVSEIAEKYIKWISKE